MSATIQTPHGTAQIKDFVWKSENERLEQYLNLATHELYPFGPPGYSPHPDLQVALDMVKDFPGSKVLSATRPAPTPEVKGVVQ